MGSHGIRDRVAIVGMGCTRFAEHWDKGVDDLLVDATGESLASVGEGLGHADVDAYWIGTAQSGMSGMVLAKPLQLEGKPVTRVENMCATGSEALRQAAYAVASGAYDVAMAVGVEKVKDSGYQGLNAFPVPTDGTNRTLTAAAMFSMVAPAYARRYGVDPGELRRALARIASKNHHNGARNERAQFRREMSVEAICAMPSVAGDLSVFDCAGVADGAAAAVVVRAEDAHRYTDAPLYVKALSLVAGNGSGLTDPGYDYTTFPEVARSAADAYAQAGVTDPRSELAMAEVHDCFTPTELVLMEDLGFAARGSAWREVLDGAFDLDGDLPVNPDGGLKSFGHPVGASGLRMLFEAWLQLRGEAPDDRRIATADDRHLALTHNLGGYPGEMVSFVSIVGTRPSD
ncbi:MAG TPA: acetyl-CoA acetyltransferase [Acidimicrobiales bacterium]|nr:acetyl-CoA acetyltransferase [Acidimicrobiales bacterium]